MIGAGMSGLAASVRLHDRGVKVLAIEARDRIGGRVHTVRDGGWPLPIELGAEFVHGEAPRIEAAAMEAGVPLYDVPGSHWRRRRNALEESEEFEQILSRPFEQVSRIVRRRGERSFEQAIREARVREPARSQALAFVEGFQAADPERISARSLSGEDLGIEKNRRVLWGYEALARRSFERLPSGAVRLNTIASEVRWKPGEVEVVCRNSHDQASETLRVSRVLVTVPLGVLQAVGSRSPSLVFTPRLPEKERAIAKLAMGNVVKIVFRFREAFWEDPSVVRARKGDDLASLGFVHGQDLPVPTWWTSRPIHSPVLTGWAGGPRAERLLILEEGKRIDRALESLAKALGIRAKLPRKLLVGWRWHDWASDPFSRGAYSYALVGGANAARSLGKPVRDTLFFAGEATCPSPSNGTVEGAFESGERAAAEILAGS